MAEKGEQKPERRKFFLNTVRSLGLATMGGAAWSGFISSAQDGGESPEEEGLREDPGGVTTKTPRSEKDPLEYLNKGDL